MIWFFIVLVVTGIVDLVLAFFALLDPNWRRTAFGMVVGLAGSIVLFVGLFGLAWELGPLVWLWVAGGH